MDIYELSPYIRLAWSCFSFPPFVIGKRIIFDYELIYLKQGKWELEVNNQIYICEEGDFVFLRPNIEHTIRNIGNITVEQPHVHFDFIYDKKSKERFVCLQPIEELTTYEKSLISEDVLEADSIPFVLKPKESEIWKSILFELIELDKRKTIYDKLVMREKMFFLCRLILTEIGEFTSTGNSSKLTSSMLEIKDFIDHYHHWKLSDKRLTLDILAEHFHLDKFYIDKTFKKMFGSPVIKYYNQKTISYAKLYLEQNKTIQEISDTFNFSSIYVFSRFFKQHTGISPTVYKRIAKNDNE